MDTITTLAHNHGRCLECNIRNGYPILGGSCTRCARDNRLYLLRCVADEHEKAWSDYCDIIYRVEVYEGDRIPPSKNRASGHDEQGDPVMGLSSSDTERARFSTPMKQPKARFEDDDDEEMTDTEDD